MPAYPLAPVVVVLALLYVTTQVWKGNPWQVIITLIALGVGYLYYFAYLRPRSDRWTMKATAPAEDEPHGEIALGPVGGLEQV
jgi:hypothetical protein